MSFQTIEYASFNCNHAQQCFVSTQKCGATTPVFLAVVSQQGSWTVGYTGLPETGMDTSEGED